MKILVTGGAGFIGSNLVERLVDEGHQVSVIDDLSSGKERNLPLEKINFYQIDIRSSEIGNVFQKERPEVLFHLAAQIDVRISVKDPILDADINILGTLNLLQNCVKYDLRKFIFASSGGCIYGEAKDLPISESHPLQPDSPYGISKVIINDYLRYYHHLFGLEYTILALGNVYGEKQDPNGEAGVVAIFAGQLLKNEKPTIYGDGNQLRDYIYVGDVVDVFTMVIKQADEKIYNIGTGIGSSVNKLFEEMADIIKYNGKPEYAPPRAGEIEKTFLDISKAKKELDWSPKYDLSSGLKKTIEWFKKQTAVDR